MAFEVEIKFRAADLDGLAALLISLGANPDAPDRPFIDAYLAHPARDFARTDEAVRLRRIGEENRVTYKGPKRPGPTKTREEIEIPFAPGDSAFEEMLKLFERLGFRPVARVEKARRAFALKFAGRPLEIALDRAGPLGNFAEIEAQAENDDDLPAAQAAVVGLAGRLGLSEVEPRSYLRMTLQLAESTRNEGMGPRNG